MEYCIDLEIDDPDEMDLLYMEGQRASWESEGRYDLDNIDMVTDLSEAVVREHAWSKESEEDSLELNRSILKGTIEDWKERQESI